MADKKIPKPKKKPHYTEMKHNRSQLQRKIGMYKDDVKKQQKTIDDMAKDPVYKKEDKDYRSGKGPMYKPGIAYNAEIRDNTKDYIKEMEGKLKSMDKPAGTRKKPAPIPGTKPIQGKKKGK